MFLTLEPFITSDLSYRNSFLHNFMLLNKPIEFSNATYS